MELETKLGHEEWQSYSAFVIERAHDLVNQHIWDGISIPILKRWIAQLESRNAQALAAILLDNLIYRSKDQFKSSLRYLFTHVPESDGVASLALLNALRGRKDPGIRVVPVLGLRNPPTKSGPYVLRIAERELNLNDRWFEWGQMVGEKAADLNTIIFIDDFCGTGTQSSDFLKNTVEIEKLRENHSNVRLIYLVSSLHERGEKILKEAFPYLELFPAERLGEQLDFFNNSFDWCPNVQNKRQLITDEYNRIVADLHFPPMKDYKLNLCFGFEHSTPNNSLPVFWCQNDNWEALLRR